MNQTHWHMFQQKKISRRLWICQRVSVCTDVCDDGEGAETNPADGLNRWHCENHWNVHICFMSINISTTAVTFWLHVHELRSSSQEDHCSRQVSTLWAWNQWMFLTRCLDIFGYVAEPGTYQYHLAYSPMSPSSRQNKAVGDRSSSSSNIHGAAVRLAHSCIPKC